MSRPAISKHLRLLRRAHLVQERREGRHRLYQLNPEPLKAVDSWLEQYRVFWQANLTSLKAFVEAEYARETAGSQAGAPEQKLNVQEKRKSNRNACNRSMTVLATDLTRRKSNMKAIRIAITLLFVLVTHLPPLPRRRAEVF